MKFISGKSIDNALTKTQRVYLAGNLALPQEIDNIDSQLEIGLSRYQHYTEELPHYHASNNEYNYVIKGTMKLYVFKERKEYEFHGGDLYLATPGLGYVTKILKGTEIIFVKSPGGNDKHVLQITPGIKKWLENWDAEMIPDWEGEQPNDLKE